MDINSRDVLEWNVVCYVVLSLVNGQIGMSVHHVTMLGYIHRKSIGTGGTHIYIYIYIYIYYCVYHYYAFMSPDYFKLW
jgi:hypothetical protein